MDTVNMKNIAFLNYDWDYEIMSAYYNGMQDYLNQDADVRLVIFHAFGRYEDLELQADAFEVFSLCDLPRYDGFILQGNRMWPPAMRQDLTDRLRALGKPVVSINYELAGACSVGTNNYEAMRELVEAVLTGQDCRRPAFVNGFATSREARARAQAYRDVCAERGYEQAEFFEAGWETERGVEVAERLLARDEPLPDIIFCCNDDIAVGVMETLQEGGVRIPEDVRVTGFDNRENSMRAQPRITTVDRNYRLIGQTALAEVVALTRGAAFRPQVSIPSTCLLSPSSGFPNAPHFKEDVAKSLYTMEHALKDFYEQLFRFQPSVLVADSIPAIVDECERYLPAFGCADSYLTINEDYFINNSGDGTLPYGPRSLLMAATNPARPLRRDPEYVYARFPSRELLPRELAGGQLYVVYPLRHGSECIGTMVTEGVSPSLKYGFVTFILTLLSGSIESVRKQMALQSANRHLDNLYVRDQLTGLYNRFGLDRFGTLAYEHLLDDYGEAMLIFVDIDNMKSINDACGHEQGDLAIQDTAMVIDRAVAGENAFAMRYGGDEFLLISRRDLVLKIKDEMRSMKASVERPYDLYLSMGAQSVRREEGLTMLEAVERADAAMYEIKRSHKERRA